VQDHNHQIEQQNVPKPGFYLPHAIQKKTTDEFPNHFFLFTFISSSAMTIPG
jgi:hypothetical protein